MRMSSFKRCTVLTAVLSVLFMSLTSCMGNDVTLTFTEVSGDSSETSEETVSA